jgi:phage tail-like protein
VVEHRAQAGVHRVVGAWTKGTFQRCDGTITQLNTALQSVASWKWYGGWPAKWELSDLDASKSEIAIESLEIAIHGLAFGEK